VRPLTWVAVFIAPRNRHPEFPGLWRLFMAPRHGNMKFHRLSGDSGCAATWKQRVPQTWQRFRNTPSSQDLRAGLHRHGNPKFPAFPSCRKMRKPVVPSRARHGNPKLPRLGRRRFRSWRDSETPKFPRLGRRRFRSGCHMETQVSPGFGTFGRQVETPNFGHLKLTPNFGRHMETPNLGAGWKPQILVAAWKPQILGAG
jgi:hypothetical protein